MTKIDIEKTKKMPAYNERFHASGGLARPTVCADFGVFSLVRAAVKPSETPACRQVAITLPATEQAKQCKHLTKNRYGR